MKTENVMIFLYGMSDGERYERPSSTVLAFEPGAPILEESDEGGSSTETIIDPGGSHGWGRP